MTTLHGYILRDLFKTFGLALLGMTALFTLGGALFNAVRGNGASAGDLVFALPILVPVVMTIAMPLAALFAAALTYGRLAADNELTACKAAGINIHRLFLSVMLLAVFVTLFMTLSINYLMPGIYREIEHYIRTNGSDIVFSQLRQRGYFRYGSDDKPQHLLTSASVRRVEDEELERRGFDRQSSRLRYFWIEQPRYLGIDEVGNLVRFVSADAALAMFDTRSGKFLITAYVREGSDYEVAKGTAVRLREQPVGPMEVPIPLPVKPSMVDLNTLLAWRAQPWRPPDVFESATGFIERLRVRHFADGAIKSLSEGQQLTLDGADGRKAVISARKALPGDKGATLNEVEILVTDASRPRGVTYRAAEARLSARMLSPTESLVDLKLKTVEERAAADPSRRGRTDPPRRHEELFIDGLRIPEAVLRETAALEPADVIGAAWRPPAGIGMDDMHAKLLKDAQGLRRKIESNIHFRLGMASSTLATVLLAAVLGVMMRGSRALVAIGLAGAVVIVVFLLIAMGKTLAENRNTAQIGPYVIWGSILITACLSVFLLRVGVRR